jgi:radical SAM protein with 4Fe4S-binding SPASM domain
MPISVKPSKRFQQSALKPELRDLISIQVNTVSERVSADSYFYLGVTVTNNSGVTISSYKPNPINVSYHWVGLQEHYEEYDGLRTCIPESLRDKSSVSFRIKIRAPASASLYELEVGLVQEHVAWFEQYDQKYCQNVLVENSSTETIDEGALYREVSVERYASDRQAQVAHPPAIFNFELTNKCPFKCIMCPRTNHMTRSEGVMDFSVFKKAIDELVEHNFDYAKNEGVWLHGFGESLVHPEFGKFICYAASKGINSQLSINPLMLTKRVRTELLDAKLGELLISFDGHDDESFQKIRGVSNAYGRSKQRLLAFLAQKVRSKSQTNITLSMINFPDNHESIEELESFWRATKGIDTVFIKPFTTWDGNADDIKLLDDNIIASKSDRPVTCELPWRKMTVNWDGDITPCCYDHDKRYVLGNIVESTLSEIWNGERMQLLREEFITNTVTNPLCKNCDYL